MAEFSFRGITDISNTETIKPLDFKEIFGKPKKDKKDSKKEVKANDRKKIMDLEKRWLQVMVANGIYNSLENTFGLADITVTKYGYRAYFKITDGLSLNMLEEKKECLEQNLGCILIINLESRRREGGCVAMVDFIYHTPHDVKFVPLKQHSPREIYIGNNFNSEPIFIDMTKFPHLLLTGGTRSGKSKLTDVILTNLIWNFNEFELELYAIQVAKDDLVLYEDAIQCRAFADTLEKTYVVLDHILHKKMPERNKLIRPLRKSGKGENYIDYNKANPNTPISTCYLVFDEMSSLFQVNGADKDTKEMLTSIIMMIEEIAKQGASLGIFLICSLQRPTADNISPIIKSQSTLAISLRQNNKRSSEVAMDDSNIALGLDQREFVYKTIDYSYGLVPWAYAKDIKKFLDPSLKPNHRNLFDDIKKLESENGLKKFEDKLEIQEVKQEVKQEIKTEKPKEDKKKEVIENKFVKVTPTQTDKEKELAKNIAKIPNFVPWEPPKQ